VADLNVGIIEEISNNLTCAVRELRLADK